MQFIREILTDESGKPSATRTSALLWTFVAIAVVVAGMIMLAYGVKDVTTFVGMVLGGSGVKSASDLWAAQTKSAKVAVATTVAPSQSPSIPSQSSPPAPKPNTDKPPGGVQ